MDSNRKPKVFRLRQLPGDANKSQALVYLSIGLGSIPVDSIHIYSLATSLSPWRPTKTATLMFNPPPALLQGDPSKDEWQIRVNGLEEPLILDTHFRGLTPLREPTSDHCFDCIALSGLSSHPFGSWQPKKGDKTFMWIRDALPLDLPQLRPIIYGYETTLPKSKSFQNITDLASQLINQLASNGWTALSAKPLVFLAHSLGGLVLKRAIVALANSGYDDSAIQIAGGIFFGVPNFGMEQSSFLSIAEGNPNEMLVEDLSPHSPWLKGLESQFNGISYLRKMNMFWGYETCTSPTLIQNDDGEIVSGPEVVLVTPQSATRGLLEINESQTFPLNENHSNIVKFNWGHEDYGVIVKKLSHICCIDPTNYDSDEIDESRSPSLTCDDIKSNGQGKGRYMKTSLGLKPARVGKSHTSQEKPQLSLEQIVDILLDSLKVTSRDDRIQGIQTHFRDTFDWIFNHSECGFLHWLQYGQGAFWINGSPGSGKSTLMKYIFQDERTRELLHDVQNSHDEVYAGFFFHHRGSAVQKSFDGLLRSILSQFLEQNQNVGSILSPLLPVKRDKYGRVKVAAHNWSRAMLEKAFTMVLKQQQFELDIFLFLDALDEYHGRPEFIASFIESLVKQEKTSMTRLKVCFSSRPWDAFTTRFKDYASITIQDFTKDDIRRYCLGVMDDNLSSDISIPIEVLVPQVVDRSKGVFLWVKLVAGDLARAANAGLSEADLERLLQSLPAELDEYYVEIVQRTPVSSRWTLYAMLEIATRSYYPLEGPDFIDAVECSRFTSWHEALSRVEKLWLLGEVEHEEYAAKQIKIHSQGLIEIRGKFVELLHQTVQEFVSQPKFNALVLDTEAKLTFENGYSFLVKWHLLDKIFDSPNRKNKDGDDSDEKGIDEEDVTQIISYGKLSEESTGRSMRTFLDSIPPKKYSRIGHVSGAWIQSSIEFAAFATLLLYFRESFQRDPSFLKKCDASNQKSLISLCLGLFRIGTDHHVSSQYLNFEGGEELARLIMDNGYKIQYDESAFHKVICYLTMSRQGDIRNKCIDFVVRFLELGQDPNAPMTIHHSSETHRLKCTALHLSPPEIVPSLLFYGAEVNYKDSDGMTPLDRLCCNVLPTTRIEIYLYGNHTRNVSDSYQVACMLADAGGQRVRRIMDESWNRLMKLFLDKGYDVETLQPLAFKNDSKGWLPWL
ncbi:uncharacterized protein F4807DRAFT_436711 [Annulohypoxylon truncatum]|uniref:uncharacterized protein n=1 Tax=Annulohypoxylon truncatum TaxID=327061 RepID=UPI002008A3F2|nr:uncharacterized protein F4807DRAFT_436711 [Annulohypoxylon truncatum]KAI1207027.1 hypothetical protein F4807DRAFT_436711 [Annulohypoxylon truncatum]